ncbi:hypothetical protein VaNZ11_012864 [Volvox africanus]|uniref:Methyltransferase type 11 domain-containing protein n=1 Tax=Volvox africanus TaxID=51714 RepID=A0ABQ5SEU8_9CHLO|nr:hypothetical protein VaNZ11_012864 [Volvox africanus]
MYRFSHLSIGQTMLNRLAASHRQAVRTSTTKTIRPKPMAMPARFQLGLSGPLQNSPSDSSKDVFGESSNGLLEISLEPLAVTEPVLSPSERAVLDTRPAVKFFEVSRVGAANTDASFERRLSALYGELLGPRMGDVSSGPGGLVLLDLCSSWTSHLPPELKTTQVIGQGMNAEELASNAALTSSFVQDLNRHTRLPLPDDSVSAVLCCNGLQYLTHPEWVMAEVRRVLVPEGLVVVAFSAHSWPERATAGWLARRSGRERLQLVERVLRSAGLTIVQLLADDEGLATGGGSPAAATTAGIPTDGTDIGGGEGARPEAARDPLFVAVAQKTSAVATGAVEAAEAVVATGAVEAAEAAEAAEAVEAAEAAEAAEAVEAAEKFVINPPAVEAVVVNEGANNTDEGSSGINSGDGLYRQILEGVGGGASATITIEEEALPAIIEAEKLDPAVEASLYIGPTLKEMDFCNLDVTPDVLERWRLSYSAMVEDARRLGIPASAIPPLTTRATAEDIRLARGNLQDMIASFLSAGL